MEPLIPELLFIGPFFAPLIIRVGLAVIFLWDTQRLAKGSTREKVHAAWSLILTVLFGIGLFTQAAAIAGIVYVVVALFFKDDGSLFKQKPTAILAIVMLLTLIVTGAGYTPFPFGDLPY